MAREKQGALVDRNTIGVGMVFGLIYAILLTIGFRHLRAETADVDCIDGECSVPASAWEPNDVKHTSALASKA